MDQEGVQTAAVESHSPTPSFKGLTDDDELCRGGSRLLLIAFLFFFRELQVSVSLSKHSTVPCVDQHHTVNFSRSHFLCPKKSYYGVLLNRGAFPQRSVHVHFGRCFNWIKGRVLRCACLNYSASFFPLWLPLNFKTAFTF